MRQIQQSQNNLPLGTTSVIFGVETDERAICKYDYNSGTDFSSMTQFTITGGIQHTKEETGLQDDQNYLYYVKCMDDSRNTNTEDYLINFSVGIYSDGGNQTPTPYCGDSNCGANESCSSCEADCGVCSLPSSDEPIYNPTTHLLIDTEDFDGFDSFASENGVTSFLSKYPRGRIIYPGGPSNNDLLASGTGDQAEDDGVLTMVTGRGGSGKALRILYAGANGASDAIPGPKKQDLDAIGDLDGTLPEIAGPYEHFFFTTWFRVSPGANPADSNSASVKGFMFWANYPNRVEWRPANLRYGGSRWSGGPRWVRGGGIPENDATGVDYWKTNDGYPPPWSDHNGGNWHKFTTEIHAGPGVPDSEKGQRVWIDGELIYDDVGRLPKLFDMFGYGAGNNWWNGDPLTGGFKYAANYATEGWSMWGNFVNGDAAAATTQFTIDFDDWIAWTNKEFFIEPAYDPATDFLIDTEDFDGFDSYTSENGNNPLRSKYPQGRAAYDGGPSNNNVEAPGTADRAEDDGVITIVSGRGSSGNALRLLYGGTGGGHDLLVGPMQASLDSVGELDGSLPEVAGPYEEFYWSSWFRTSVGANPADASGSSVKGFMFWYANNFPGRSEWRPAMLRYGGSRWDGTHGEPGGSGPRWVRGGGNPENTVTAPIDYQQLSHGYPPKWSDYNDGNWHKFTIYLKTGTDVPPTERGHKIWLDGILVYSDLGQMGQHFDHYGFGVGKDWLNRDYTGGLAWTADKKTAGWSVWGNFVSQSAASSTTQFTIDFDDWIAWTN
jgi:hypothetical protein